MNFQNYEIDRLQAWIKPFGQEIANEVFLHLTHSREKTWVWGPTSAFDNSGFFPSKILEYAFNIMGEVSRELPEEGKIVILLNLFHPGGLTKIEAEVIFDGVMKIERIEEVKINELERRMLIIAIPRQEYVGLTFRFPNYINSKELTLIFEYLKKQDLFKIGLFITHEQARMILYQDNNIYSMLLELIQSQKLQLALSVPSERTDLALDNIVRELSPLHYFPTRVEIIRFEAQEYCNLSSKLEKIFQKSKLKADASFWGGYSDDFIVSRNQSYLQTGAYFPQAFDLRIPAANHRDNEFIELITLSLAPTEFRKVVFKSWQDLWNYRICRKLSSLSDLLDFTQEQEYFNKMGTSLELQQKYHNHQVYNWRVGESINRTTLVDGGYLDTFDRISHLIEEGFQFKTEMGKRWQMVALDKLVSIGYQEASENIMNNPNIQLSGQLHSHDYLMENEKNNLPVDVVDFTQFVPFDLGVTLEIGSGPGRLASQLSSRSSNYYCLDLSLEAMKYIGKAHQLKGLVGDLHILPFKTNSVDSIIANNVLEHAYDPILALKEIRRVLKPTGRLFAIIPFDKMGYTYNLPTHLWKADSLSIKLACEEANLKIHRFEVVDNYKLGITESRPSCCGLSVKIDIGVVCVD